MCWEAWKGTNPTWNYFNKELVCFWILKIRFSLFPKSKFDMFDNSLLDRKLWILPHCFFQYKRLTLWCSLNAGSSKRMNEHSQRNTEEMLWIFSYKQTSTLLFLMNKGRRMVLYVFRLELRTFAIWLLPIQMKNNG